MTEPKEWGGSLGKPIWNAFVMPYRIRLCAIEKPVLEDCLWRTLFYSVWFVIRYSLEKVHDQI